MDNILNGLINYAKDQIELQLRHAAEEITARVLADTMCRLNVKIQNHPESFATSIEFHFTKKENTHATD